MNTLQLCAMVLVSVSLDFCSEPVDYTGLYGFWGKTVKNEGAQHYMLYFHPDNGGVKGEFHSYLDGMKFGSLECEEIEFDGKNISMITNKDAGVRYEGEVDYEKNIIEGEMIYSNGQKMDFDLLKFSDEKIKDEFPGLYNLKVKDYSYKEPMRLNDGLEVSTLDENDIEPNLLAKMVNKIIQGEFGKVNSVLIVRNGKLVFENYFDGFSENDLHALQSCTKSISSLLVGIAIDKGYIKSVDQKLLDFYSEYRYELSTEWQSVQLKHVLTMTMGLNWNENYHNDIWRLSNDVIQSTFEQKFAVQPGKKFEYRNPQIDLLAGVLTKSTGMTVQEFADKNLFKPLGIEKYQWQNFKQNNYPLMDGSLCLRPRDMAKIGLMVLNDGKWKDKQIVSNKWIGESTSFKIKADEFMDYGYLWWIGHSQNRTEIKAVLAIGAGGQHIIIVPQLSAVIVTTGDNMDKPPAFLLKMVDQFIISSIK